MDDKIITMRIMHMQLEGRRCRNIKINYTNKYCYSKWEEDIPTKLKFTWWCACNMHAPLILLNRPLALGTRFRISQYPVIKSYA